MLLKLGVDVPAPRAVHPFSEYPQMTHKVPFPSAGTKPGGFGYSLVGALHSPSDFSQELLSMTEPAVPALLATACSRNLRSFIKSLDGFRVSGFIHSSIG